SFFSSDCFFSAGSGGSSEAGTGGWMPSAGARGGGGAAAAAAASASCSRTQSSAATGRSSAGSAFGLRRKEISFFQNGLALEMPPAEPPGSPETPSTRPLARTGGFAAGLRRNEISFFQNGTGFSAAVLGDRLPPKRSESLISFFQS